MRFWLHAAVRTKTIAPSAALSVVVHLFLVAAAVRETAINARELEESLSQHIAYLPPPDRRGSRANAVERIDYVALGGGLPVPLAGTGILQVQGAPRDAPLPGGDPSVNDGTFDTTVDDVKPDSVYSVLEVEERAARTANSAAPAYPAELMKEGREGSVFIRFVVDTTGHADTTTLEIVRATHPLFAESVRSAMPRMVFTPAMVGGRRVRQAVEQNFDFRIAQAPVQPAPPKRTSATP